MTDEDRLLRARQAEVFLSDPILSEAFRDIELHYVELWKGSRPRDYEFREECHMALHALHQLKNQLRTYVETGKLLVAASSGPNERKSSPQVVRADHNR